MEEKEKKIGPFSLEPADADTPWGSESWKLADLGFRDSVVHEGPLVSNTLSEIMETYLDRIVGDDTYYFYGRQFPVLLRTFCTTARTPLTVSPDDEVAYQRYDALGKLKLWHVTGAEDGAMLYIGLKRDFSATEFYDACLSGSVLDGMNEIPVRAGDSFIIGPGTVHCAGKGVKILEIAESSGLDFRLCGWNRFGADAEERSFLEEAFDFVNLKKETPRFVQGPKLAEEPQFAASMLNLTQALRIDNSNPGGYTVYHCLDGRVSVQYSVTSDESPVTESLTFGAGETVVVPADNESFLLVPASSSATLVEVVAGKRETLDSYTRESVDTLNYGIDREDR